MTDLRIQVADVELAATWTAENPETRSAIRAALPLAGEAARWGDELYFPTPVDVPAEVARAEVPVGAIAYWPQGNALCLFWGPTPASEGQQPRAASPVNVVAMLDDVGPLDAVGTAPTVTVEAA